MCGVATCCIAATRFAPARGSPLAISATLTAVGFEPTPLRTGAWSQRLRPLGQTVLEASKSYFVFKTSPRWECKMGATAAESKHQESASKSIRRERANAQANRSDAPCRQAAQFEARPCLPVTGERFHVQMLSPLPSPVQAGDFFAKRN